jgi:putative ABC transport system permease protein
VVAAAPLSPPLRAETGAPTLYLAGGRSARAWTVYTSPALLEVLGLRVLEGALQGAAEGGPPPVLITRRVRERLFPRGAPAVGQLVGADDSGAGRVAGVLEDFMLREPFWDEAQSVVLRFTAPVDRDAASFVVRAHPGEQATVALRLRTMAAELPGPTTSRMVSSVAYASAKPRFQRLGDGVVLVFLDFGVTFVVIALVGAVAVASFVVAARRREIGIRRALGATRRDVLRHFLVESTLAATLGIGIGLALTVALLFGMRRAVEGLPIGLWQLTVTALFMWVIAAVAALIPARRAARIPPTMATRGS